MFLLELSTVFCSLILPNDFLIDIFANLVKLVIIGVSLRFCSIGTYKFKLNLSANYVNLFLSDFLIQLNTYYFGIKFASQLCNTFCNGDK